eukprot:130172_1
MMKNNINNNALQQLIKTLKPYDAAQKDNNTFNMDSVNIMSVLNSFLYLLNNYNDNKAFEFIYNALGGYCDADKCGIFRRNFINKTSKDIQTSKTSNVNIDHCHYRHQILDKIHCYYRHCFDIGHKLYAKQRMELNEHKYCSDDDSKHNESLINHEISQIKTFLDKNKTAANIAILNKRTNVKYNTIEAVNSDSNDKMYSFGFPFRYGYQGESDVDLILSNRIVSVQPKYTNLKSELVQNDIYRMTIEQYNNEYNKALVHYNSTYCKQTFKAFVDKRNNQWTLWIQHILSLMVYCNYTELQYKFSETYRVNNGKKHQSFYYLGVYLKIAVKKFGTKIAKGSTNHLFHGIGEQLLFPQYIGCGRALVGVSICGPLSTSSSFEVATNFA